MSLVGRTNEPVGLILPNIELIKDALCISAIYRVEENVHTGQTAVVC